MSWDVCEILWQLGLSAGSLLAVAIVAHAAAGMAPQDPAALIPHLAAPSEEMLDTVLLTVCNDCCNELCSFCCQ